MNTFIGKQFNVGELKGISQTNISEHLNLYSGYVKHANIIREKIEELSNDVTGNAFLITELQRRFSFEFGGMRNHEIYFSSLSGGASVANEDSDLYKKIVMQWGSYDKWLELFKQTAKTRGVGWAILSHDPSSGELLNSWTDEQHLGQLNGAIPVLMLDMWEHAFVADYQPSGKGQYIDDFFENLNWSTVEENYNQAVK